MSECVGGVFAGQGFLPAAGSLDCESPVVQSLLAANDLFFRAIESGDGVAMDDLWKRSPTVACTHPGWKPIFGRENVLRSWKALRLPGSSVTVAPIQVLARVVGDGGVVSSMVRLGERHSSAKPTGYSEAEVAVTMTNVFEKAPEGVWKLVCHHAAFVEMVVYNRGAAIGESRLLH